METKYRYRNKDGKIQVQKLVNGKWISRTLPSAEEVFMWLCPTIVSNNATLKEENKPQTFAQSLLTEPSKQDTLTEDQIFKEAKKAQNKLMDELLK